MSGRRGVAIGFAAGVLAAVVAMILIMPRVMLQIRPSGMGVDETVSVITQRVAEAGWVVSGVVPLDASVRKHGGGDVATTRLVNICQATHAADILRDEASRRVSVMMPCTIAVYADDAGRTQVATMNAGLLGRMFGGTIARVMAGPVARDQAGFVDFGAMP
jgi:uncharacterized protein (DUF302 family)